MTSSPPAHPGSSALIDRVDEGVYTFHAAEPHEVKQGRLEVVPLDALVFDEWGDEELRLPPRVWRLSLDLEFHDPNLTVWYIEPDRSPTVVS